ncbi:MAG: VacJ family lipoprotein [Chthoniobacterales bacterium]
MKILIQPALALTTVAFLASCASNSNSDRTAATSADTVVVEEEYVGVSGEVPSSAAGDEFDDLDEYDAVIIPDPIEPVNRATFALNDGIYYVLLRPAAKGYEFLIPKPARTGITNVFENARFPVRFVNNALQGNFERMSQEMARFLINSTAGVGGIFKVSDLAPSLADVQPAGTGQTFAKWGIPHGAYLVLPVLGPSSVRDAVGLVGDRALSPVTYVGVMYNGAFFSDTYDWTVAIPATSTVSSLPNAVAIYDAATEDAIDPYLSAKGFYVQYRDEVAKEE